MARQIQPLHPGDTVRVRGERWVVVRQCLHGEVAAIDLRGADTANVGEHARFLLPFEPVERLTTPRVPKIVRPAEWRLVARSVLAAATPRIDALRAAGRARFDVMPYQLEPALAVTSGVGCRLLIADEVGLGKTVQAGLIVAELLERTPDGRALVICPAGLRAQWQEELWRRFHLSAALLDSTGIARTAGQFDGSANPWSALPLVIASIDFVKRAEVMRALEGLIWDVIVMDEAHNLTSRSDRATAAAALARRARTVVMLSATPHSGDDAAFARLCALGDAHDRFPLLFFRRTRAEAGIPVVRRERWLHVRPTPAELEMHDALRRYANRVWQEHRPNLAGRLAVSVLLQRAASSATSLGRSIERRLESVSSPVPPPAPQLDLPFLFSEADEEPLGTLAAPALYNADEERQYLKRIRDLARVAAACESKVAALRRWLARVHEPVIVFTEYRDTLAHLRTMLTSHRRDDGGIVELHGGLTRSERAAAERAFTNGEADVMLATDAASEGLNLHRRCRCVINLETPWNPVRLEQRIGRVDRIGQQRRVHAVHLVAAGTLEPVTVRRVMDRARRAAGALRYQEPNQVDVANAALTGVDLPDSRPPAEMAAPLQRPDLRSVASAEAARIAVARRVQPSRPIRDRRPIITSAHRSTRVATAVFEIGFVDADGLPVWDTLIGVTCTRAASWRRRRDLRWAVMAIVQRMTDAAADASLRVALSSAVAWQSLTTTQAAREQAIAAAVRLRHARIAAELLQPGLFDRRAERQAASQSAVLEEALGRCNARLDALARLSTLQAAPPAWRFAVLTR